MRDLGKGIACIVVAGAAFVSVAATVYMGGRLTIKEKNNEDVVDYVNTIHNSLDDRLTEDDYDWDIFDEDTEDYTENVQGNDSQFEEPEIFQAYVPWMPADSYLKFLEVYKDEAKEALMKKGIPEIDLGKGYYYSENYIYYVAKDTNGDFRYVKLDCYDFSFENIQLVNYIEESERPYDIPDGDTDMFRGIILLNMAEDFDGVQTFNLLPSEYCSLIAQARDLLGLSFEELQSINTYDVGVTESGNTFIQFYAINKGIFFTVEDTGNYYSAYEDTNKDKVVQIQKDKIERW